MEAQDLLSDEVQIRGPAVLAFYGADIGNKRIEPHIKNVRRVCLEWNAPLDTGSRDREIRKPLFYECQHLVAAYLRLNEIRICFVKLEKRLRKCRELEEIVLFGNFLVGLSRLRIDIAGLGVIYEGFADYGI